MQEKQTNYTRIFSLQQIYATRYFVPLIILNELDIVMEARLVKMRH